MQTVSDNVRVETDCTIYAPDGTPYTASGAMISPAYAFAYCKSGEEIPQPVTFRSGGKFWRAGTVGSSPWLGTLTTWEGEKVGTYTITGEEWRGYHFRERWYRVAARINGIDYHGITQGPGCYVKLRAYTASLRRYNAREDLRRWIARGDTLYTRIVWTSRDNLRWRAEVYIPDPAATDGAYMDITETVALAIGWDYRDGTIRGGGIGIDRASQLTYDVSGELFRNDDGTRDGYALRAAYHYLTLR